MATILKAANSFTLEAGVESAPQFSGASLKAQRMEQTLGKECKDRSELKHVAAIKIAKMFVSYLARRRLNFAIRKRRIRSSIGSICVYSLFLFVFSFASVLVMQDQMIYHLGSNIRGQFTATEFEDEDTFVLKTFNDGSYSSLTSCIFLDNCSSSFSLYC